MRKARYLLIVILVSSFALMGCDKGSSSKSTNRRTRGAQGQALDVLNGLAGSCSAESGDYAGSIYVENDSYGDFREVVRGFLTGLGDPDSTDPDYGLNFGDIDGECGANTGFFFDGNVETQEGFSMTDLNNSNIKTGSSIRLAIIDTTALRDGGEVIDIKANEGASGYIEDDYINISFYWSGGEITLEGWIDYDNRLIEGYADFENDYHWDGSTPGKGSFGLFEIPMCSFFKCTN